MGTYKFVCIALLLCCSAGVVGCGSASSSSSGNSGGTSMDALAGAVDAQNAARKQQEDASAAKAAAEQAAVQAAQTSTPPPRKEAGRAPMKEGGYLTAIAGARRHILNEAESWAWKQAVQHFKATEGRKPKDHDEFMKKIVIPLDINLGFKEENQEFFYDPNAESDGDLGVLYVVEVESAAK